MNPQYDNATGQFHTAHTDLVRDGIPIWVEPEARTHARTSAKIIRDEKERLQRPGYIAPERKVNKPLALLYAICILALALYFGFKPALRIVAEPVRDFSYLRYLTSHIDYLGGFSKAADWPSQVRDSALDRWIALPHDSHSMAVLGLAHRHTGRDSQSSRERETFSRALSNECNRGVLPACSDLWMGARNQMLDWKANEAMASKAKIYDSQKWTEITTKYKNRLDCMSCRFWHAIYSESEFRARE